MSLFKKGNFSKAIEVFEKTLMSKTSEYHSMRKVWIAKVLLESLDLSAFSWLEEVITDTKKVLPSDVNKSKSFRERIEYDQYQRQV